MPLSRQRLLEIRDECFADDVEIDFEVMQQWDEARAFAFFENPTVEPAAPPPPPAPQCRPQIALLHGTASNAGILRIQLGPLLTRLEPLADLHFIEGTRTVADDAPQAAKMRQFFGQNQVLKEYCGVDWDERRWRTYPELDMALDAVVAQLRAIPGGRGPDALIGFSQGANLITCLAAMAENAQQTDPADGASAPYASALRSLRSVVMLSPHLPGWTHQRPDLFAPTTRPALLGTPAIVAWSRSDTFVFVGEDSTGDNTAGPPECVNLWQENRALEIVHSGPGHRPMPKDVTELSALCNKIVDLVTNGEPCDRYAGPEPEAGGDGTTEDRQ